MDSGQNTAVLFAELLGTAELYARAGDAAAHEIIQRSVRNLGGAAESCGARVLKTLEGRVMVLAPSPDEAAAAAVAMQLAADEFSANGAAGLELGVGFHYGPVIADNGDVFGDAVNLAARLVEQAAPGQILLAAETAAALRTVYRRATRRLYALPLRGRSEAVALCELMWRADQAPTVLPNGAPADALSAALRLEYLERRILLRGHREVLTIGRDAGCDLVVAGEAVSRQHCTIQQRHDHFVLADRSTNGTWVTVEGEGEVLLEREELTLRRHGWISLGAPRGKAAQALLFFCE